MKTSTRACLIFVFILVLAYLSMAFLLWDFNPGKWSETERFMMLGVGGGSAVGFAFISLGAP